MKNFFKKLELLSKYFFSIQNVGLFNYLYLRKEGINIFRYQLFNKQWIKELNIRSIIDIGANIGEMTKIFDLIFKKPSIFMFEPLEVCRDNLQALSNKSDNIKFFPYALGNSDEKKTIFKSSWVPSSSLLEMTDEHKKLYPHSSGSAKENIHIKPLDQSIDHSKLIDNLMIKVDVQGYEKEVIAGGREVFTKAKLIIIELSYLELYEGEPGFHDIYTELLNLGFTFKGALKQSENPDDGSYIQIDAIFIK